jgi:hypothetical protein
MWKIRDFSRPLPPPHLLDGLGRCERQTDRPPPRGARENSRTRLFMKNVLKEINPHIPPSSQSCQA